MNTLVLRRVAIIVAVYSLATPIKHHIFPLLVADNVLLQPPCPCSNKTGMNELTPSFPVVLIAHLALICLNYARVQGNLYL